MKLLGMMALAAGALMTAGVALHRNRYGVAPTFKHDFPPLKLRQVIQTRLDWLS